MKCLSVRQPFATLIVTGRKKIETRRWTTIHRGRLLIQASLTAETLDEEFQAVLGELPERVLKAKGVIVGEVEIVDCRPIERADRTRAFYPTAPDLFAWVLKSPVVFDKFRDYALDNTANQR